MPRSEFRQSLCHAKLDDAVRSRVRSGDEGGIEDCEGVVGKPLEDRVPPSAPSQTEEILLWKSVRTANPAQTTGIFGDWYRRGF